jgi:exosortase
MMTTTPLSTVSRLLTPRRAVLAGLAALLAYTYWPTLSDMVRKWESDPQYSHGYLVPAFALALLWLRRQHWAAVTPAWSWWGVWLLTAGALLHLAGSYLYYDWLSAGSLLPSLAGLFALWGGRPALRWAWPALGFLAFMVPLPYRVEVLLSHPLQRLATRVGTYSLETLGFPVVAEGNTIVLEGMRIGIAEACSGLSMLVTFVALSAAVVLVSRRSVFDKSVIVLSAVPIAVLANMVRIIVTAVLCETVGSAGASAFFHDWAGWFMMPLALGLLWLELLLLGRLLPETSPAAPAAVDFVGLAAAAYPSRKKQGAPASPAEARTPR